MNGHPIISIVDPAIDWPAMGKDKIEQYRKTRDVAMLSAYVKPDRQPVTYLAREIPVRNMRFVSRGTQEDRACAAFAFAVQRVENFRPREGGMVSSYEPVRHTDVDAIKDEALEAFEFSDMLEIGWHAYERSFFRRRTDVVWQLPDLLLELWAGQAFHRAPPSPP